MGTDVGTGPLAPQMTWIKVLWESMTWRDFDFLTQRRLCRLLMPQVIRNENPVYYDPPSTLVMDSKRFV